MSCALLEKKEKVNIKDASESSNKENREIFFNKKNYLALQ